MISVIIPVYNVEPYLRQCLDSVLAQTYQDYEVILVDDGSTDGSGGICEEYAKKDGRIRVIHKENGGLVSARKAGFEVSLGDYIANIDSDDWVEPNHLEILYQTLIANHADIAQTDYFIYSEEGEHLCVNKPSSDIPCEIISDCLDGTIHSGVVFKLISRRLYEKDNFRFPLCDFNEDLHTSISLLVNSQKYSYASVPTYHYRMNNTSLTHERTQKSIFRKYRECMTNLEDIYIRLGIKNDCLLRDKLLKRVNLVKRDLIKIYPHVDELSSLLYYFPQSYSITEVKSLGDFFYYMACNWGMTFPYKIKRLLK